MECSIQHSRAVPVSSSARLTVWRSAVSQRSYLQMQSTPNPPVHARPRHTAGRFKGPAGAGPGRLALCPDPLPKAPPAKPPVGWQLVDKGSFDSEWFIACSQMCNSAGRRHVDKFTGSQVREKLSESKLSGLARPVRRSRDDVRFVLDIIGRLVCQTVC